jgi:hypothetical protein
MSDEKDRHKPVRLISSKPEDDPPAAQAQLFKRLSELADAMDKPHIFQKGQVVRWKAGLKNRAAPAYNEAVLVLRYWLSRYSTRAKQHVALGAPILASP